MKKILIIIKPTLNCNADCSYCVYKDKKESQPMGEDVFEKILLNLNNSSKISDKIDLHLLWHGGEPTLMGKSFFEMVRLKCELYEKTFNINHYMQSNLLDYSDETIESILNLLEYKSISTSYDPFSKMRLSKTLINYNERWLNNFNELKEKGIQINVVYTAHLESLGREQDLYYFFKNIGISGLQLNPSVAYGKSEHIELTDVQYGAFLFEMWKVWIKDGQKMHIEPFSGWYGAVYKKKNIEKCNFNGRCAIDSFLVISNGDTYPCGRHYDHNINKLGNVFSDSFEDMSYLKKKHLSANKKNECSTCSWLALCHGGCPMENSRDDAVKYKNSRYCNGYKLFFNKAFSGKLGI